MNLTSPDTSFTIMQASQEGRIQALKGAAQDVKNARDTQKVEEAAKQFEAVFVGEMMKPMFDGISSDGTFGGGKGEEIFRGLLIQEYGKMIAQTGDLGLTSQIKDQMIKLQEQADNAAQAQNK